MKLDSSIQAIYRDSLLQFELGDILTDILRSKMREEGSNFGSYLLPLYFFLFMYFAGFLFTLPLVSSVFTQQIQGIDTGTQASNDTEDSGLIIPLYKSGGEVYGIPLIVIQWGFLGGLVYTSISLLNRFLRKDLTPRVYFNAAFRLILSSVVAVVIYFIFMSRGSQPNEVQPYILLIAFLAGVAPIQFLINFADTLLSKISSGWRRRNTPGNRSIRRLDGINSVTAERLSEEGIDYVQQMALCNPRKLEQKTNFPLGLIRDWREQAILYILTGDILIDPNNATQGDNATKHESSHNDHLNYILSRKAGIRTISAFIDLWKYVSSNDDNSLLKEFFNSLEVLDRNEKNFLHLKILFENIYKQGFQMKNETEDTDLVNILDQNSSLEF